MTDKYVGVTLCMSHYGTSLQLYIKQGFGSVFGCQCSRRRPCIPHHLMLCDNRKNEYGGPNSTPAWPGAG